MRSNHSILILQKSSDQESRLQQLFQAKGYSCLVIADHSQLLKSLKQLTLPILVVDCGKAEENFDFFKEIVKVEETREFPLILLGSDAASYDNIINRYYKLGTSLTTPCDQLQVLEAVGYMERMYEVRQRELLELKKAEASRVVEVKEEIPSFPVHDLFKAFQSVPSLLFSQLNEFDLRNKSFEGGQYAVATRDNFKSRDYLPTDPRVQEKVIELTSRIDRWGCSHIHRCAFMTFKMLDALRIQAPIKEDAQVAAFLFCWSFAETCPNLCRRDYLGMRSSGFRRELSNRLKESAGRIESELSNAGAAEIVRRFSSLVSREHAPDDDPLSICASALMAADLVDRCCWSNEYFNPRAVHKFLKKIKAGEITDIHPSVLTCVVSFLSQAKSPREILLLVPRHIRNNRELIEFAESIRDQKIDPDERKVPINALSPGMRLSRPVFAFDGEQILSENLILDEDLIWRLWQLASVRPLNTPLVVRESN